MRRGSKKAEPDEAPGAPEWMVTFSDCMTLLLTFFVLLLSFSSFDEKVFWKLKASFSKALPGINLSDEASRDSVLPTEQIEATPELVEGSEKPTLAKGLEDNLKEDTPADYRRLKVFSISSERIFWGRGTLISAEGRRIMTKMASFLKEIPARVVVSENGPVSEEGSEQLGLSRAWAVMKYLTTEHNLNNKWFSISAASTLAQGSLRSSEPARASTEPERILEIVLLERSIYN
ncbi:MAG TPA: flagellar motor protein MotB [Sedimentisphaerales bacterium]|nr:flagellar motor protein MotB [Sedimentisphaerales bacterium]